MISGATSTTIARIPRGKGDRRIRPRHNQRPISARFDGNPTVGPCIRRRWLPDLSETRSLRSSVNLDKTSIPIPRNHSAFPHRRALLGCDRFPATGASRKCDSAHFRKAITVKISSPVTIRQTQVIIKEFAAIHVQFQLGLFLFSLVAADVDVSGFDSR